MDLSTEDLPMENILRCHEIVKTDFVKADNCYLYDRKEQRFIDFESGIWCTALGHCHPRINKAIHAQLEKVIHLGTRYPHFLAQESAKAVLNITGIDAGKCIFLSSGSEAVEFGVQIARRVSSKPKLLTFSNSYLGAYGSAGSKSEDEWIFIDWQNPEYCDSCEYLESIPFEQIGAFVLEPGGSGPGFIHFPPKKLVETIAQRIRDEKGIIISNEITTGIGRTGKWFGYHHYEIQPDIVAIGKGLGNGYPVSCVALNLNIAEKLEASSFYYAQSHQNDPLGCAVAKEVIATIEDGDLIAEAKTLGAFFLDGLTQMEKKIDSVKNARGRGLMIALELHPDKNITATWAYHSLLAKGFVVGYYPQGNILRFDPALTIEKSDIVHLLACLESILTVAESKE